jgi:CheY-like chemotaxis protein
VLARSSPEAGTEFEVLLPLSQAVPMNDTDGRAAPSKGTGRILLVDDEPSLIRLGSDMLSSLGYSVKTAANGMRALEILKTDSEGFDLLVTDMTMPGMTGLDLAREVRALFPRLAVLLCTGYSDILTPEAAREAGILQVIAKPFTFQEFSAAIGQVLSTAVPATMV